MLDFAPVRNKETTVEELAADLTKADFVTLTNEMIDTVLGLIEECTDADVTFVPVDPDAHDAYAEDPADDTLPWTLGHVIVHMTASSEEGAAIAAELARGVEFHGRSRYETPWESMTTVAQCRQRLEESRRMQLASLEMWPDEPQLDHFYVSEYSGKEITTRMRFVFGLSHADNHLEQIAEIVRQSYAA